MRIALVGNQNCGKTTLFNALTGSNQRVGNFPGVTVDGKVGKIKAKDNVDLIDLPGIYSLTPYSNEEIVTRDYIIKEKPDVVLNIIDATNIERNLYLTMQLLELGVPLVVALNMMDEVTNSGNSIDIDLLKEKLGVDVLPIVASKNQGVDDLIKRTIYVGENKILPSHIDVCEKNSPVHRAIHAVMHLVEDHCEKYQLPKRYVATQLIQRDHSLEKEIALSENEVELLEHIIKEMENDNGYDSEISIAMMRYNYIDKITLKTVHKKNELTKEHVRSVKIDKILTNKYLAFPLFILIIAFIFFITFGLVNNYLSSYLGDALDSLIEIIRRGMTSSSFNPVLVSLICDGILTGVFSVLSFLPTVVVLFFFLSLLEDTGYMARVAFIMDKPLRKIGLTGRSFVPLLIGFGCSVPAVMSTRTSTSERDKKLTLMLIPFVPCSAKLPIFTALVGAFFKLDVLIILGLYLLSICLGVLVGFISKLIIKTKPSPFMMELPNYRLPTLKNTGLLIWEKAKDFIKKAFTVIFLCSLIIWFLNSFDFKFNYVDGTTITLENSMLSKISSILVPLFKPIGITDWRYCAALISGLSAKEALVSTLSVLYGSIDLALSGVTTGQLVAFLVFVLLYMPCFATFAVLRKELKSTPLAICYMLGQTLFAYLVSVMFYGISLLC